MAFIDIAVVLALATLWLGVLTYQHTRSVERFKALLDASGNAAIPPHLHQAVKVALARSFRQAFLADYSWALEFLLGILLWLSLLFLTVEAALSVLRVGFTAVFEMAALFIVALVLAMVALVELVAIRRSPASALRTDLVKQERAFFRRYR